MEEKPAEICLSPSWSDLGDKARRKEKRKAEKEQKERERKSRQAEEQRKSIDLKAGKRLSKKPPPAAMETQKMPTSLRRNSWVSLVSAQSSSGENSRRPSREEKRHSGISLGSFRSKRSQSTPATKSDSTPASDGASESWQSIVSPSAPKLPNFRWSSSRKASPDRKKSSPSRSDESYEKDLIAFAYRLEASGIMTEPESVNASRPDLVSKSSTNTATFGKRDSEPDFKSISYDSVSDASPQRSPTKSVKHYASKSDESVQSRKSSPTAKGSRLALSPPNLVQSPKMSSRDGSSYVHKQRMYQQQLSIVGFQDQQAIEEATEAARMTAVELEAKQLQGTGSESGRIPMTVSPAIAKNFQQNPINNTSIPPVNASPIYTKQRDRSTSPRDEPTANPNEPMGPAPPPKDIKRKPEVSPEQQRRSSQVAEDSESTKKIQAPTSHKPDKILGFRRRSKQPPALISVPYSVENEVVAIQSAPSGPSDDEPLTQRSRIEQLFRGPRPAFAARDRRSSSSSSQTRVKEVQPEVKPTQSHSRTRTASSTVLTDQTSSPLLQQNNKLASTDSDKPITKAIKSKNDSLNQGKAPISSKKTLVEDSRPQRANHNKKSNPEHDISANANVATKAKRSSESAPDAIEGAKRQAHEVIVASETGEGLIRKTSITRPRSNPQLRTQATSTNSPSALDFLPPLKHQPLIKRERQSPTRAAPTDTSPISIAQFQEPVAPLAYEPPSPPDLKLIPRSPLRPPSQFPVPAANRFNRSSTEVGSPAAFGKGTLTDGGIDTKPVAKLFVICCKCKFWHDLPSKLYEAMALPLELHKADRGKVAGARLETAVKCPWCEHAMTTGCCQGWTTLVYLHERHH